MSRPLVALFTSLLFPICAAHANLCDKLVRKPVVLNAQDFELFEKSKTAPVLSGGIIAEKDGYNHKKGDLVNEWHVYFIRNESQSAYDSPTKTLIGLKERLNAIAKRRADAGDFGYPLSLFFISGEVLYDRSSRISDKLDKQQPFLYQAGRHKNIFFGVEYSVLFKVNGEFRKYQFTGPKKRGRGTLARQTAIILLGDGDGANGSGWQDDFTVGHEIGHGTSFNYLGTPKYFNEGQADFKAFLYTNKTTFDGGPERDIADPSLKTPANFFVTFAKSADNYQLGSMFAHYLYGLWQHQKAMGWNLNFDSMFYRMMSLLDNASPHVKHEGAYINYNFQERYGRIEAIKALNFLASTMIQWSVERQLPFEVTQWMCNRWLLYMGVPGPFKRYRLGHVSEDGERTLEYIEERYNDLKFPDEWNTCEDLAPR